MGDARNIDTEGALALDAAALAQLGARPEAYQINNGIANVSGLHAAGYHRARA